ncbi:RNA polymerase sigma factor [Paraflavitalea speifideaquila]|uniref:RNA polymerase sigma factor n=1 Tax=Paraflavitalea speifideaquila TaxID=3076558 RepID=UPI0028EC1E7C|nr:RNA polymerase sigma factor [Paraflavitalea speifideiaquila]
MLDDLVKDNITEDDIPALIGIKSEEYVQPDEIFNLKQTQQLLISAIEQLPPLYRAIVTLYHTHEYSYEEISAICALPIGTVKSYLYRSRRQLKEILLHHVNKEDL